MLLSTWFELLASAAQAHGGILTHAAVPIAEVLAYEREIVLLHADLHHEIILDFEERGRLAIDPKWMIGERGFEYAIPFCDRGFGPAHLAIVRRLKIFASRLEVVSATADLETRRLLRWRLARGRIVGSLATRRQFGSDDRVSGRRG